MYNHHVKATSFIVFSTVRSFGEADVISLFFGTCLKVEEGLLEIDKGATERVVFLDSPFVPSLEIA